jgi:hypothetical protein
MNPPERVPGHEPQHERLRGNPTGQAAEPGDLTQNLGALLEFEMPQIFQDDRRHSHPQSGGKILHRHGLLLFLVRQKVNQASR